MDSSSDLLALARRRALADHLPYAGALTPTEAHALLLADPSVLLVDVRTEAERDWIGTVLVPETQYAEIDWTLYPSGATNPEFMPRLERLAARDRILLFLCRSGVRSRHAATLAAECGYTHCIDVLEGFEGDRDDHGHRKTVGGWCVAGLPWLGA